LGLGRGKHYDQRHEDTLKRIQELQAAGHSLDAIKKILSSAGDSDVVPIAAGAPPARPAEAPEIPQHRPRPRAMLSAQLWTRLRIAPGVEIHLDASRHNPTVEQLLALREAVQRIFENDNDDNLNGTDDQNEAQQPARKEHL
jgi:DNA-binding transcriptional MerR regulator